MKKTVWAGVDVGKSHIDVSLGGKSHRRFRVKDELEAAADWVANANPEGVVMEATGGYEKPIAAVFEKRFAVAIVNPRWVRDFAKSRGALAKTDKLDAGILAEFGATNTPRTVPARSSTELRLRDYVVRREQLVEQRKLAMQQREHAADTWLSKQTERLVAFLDGQIAAVEKACQELVQADEQLRTRCTRMQTVPGIGPVIATSLAVYMPELGTLDRAQIAALAGLAPMNCDSGAMRGQRHIRGGRRQVRRLLYLAAAVNQRCRKSRFKELELALRARGKPIKIARIAVARRILITLNAMLHAARDFDPQLACAA